MPAAPELSGCGKVVRGTWETKLGFLMLKMPGQNTQLLLWELSAELLSEDTVIQCPDMLPDSQP